MPVVKRAVSFDPQVWADLQRLAADRSTPVSTLINSALRHELRIHRGLEAVAAWEREHDAFSQEEIDAADRILDAAQVGIDPDGADAA